MCTCRLLFRWNSAINIQLNMLVKYKANFIAISLNVTCSRHDPNVLLKNCSFSVETTITRSHHWQISSVCCPSIFHFIVVSETTANPIKTLQEWLIKTFHSNQACNIVTMVSIKLMIFCKMKNRNSYWEN